MIRVLQTWQEIGEATLALQHQRLPNHLTVQKNWDHVLLYQAINGLERHINIVDLGCGEGHTLKLLYALGFQSIYGLDLSISWKVRLAQVVRKWRQKTLKPPFHLRTGDITRTPFPDQTFEIALSVSTIEHGVDVDLFLKEASRILKPGGLLFLTTDYWEKKVKTDSSMMAFGLPWMIFSREEIGTLLESAQSCGLNLLEPTKIPACSEPTVSWQNCDYTFISLLFRKTSHPDGVDYRHG